MYPAESAKEDALTRESEFIALRNLAEAELGGGSDFSGRGAANPNSVPAGTENPEHQGPTSPLERLTQNGRSKLEGHEVDGVVILAAGLSTRLAPLSYERPKPLFRVLGEVLIERLIKQARQAGIPNAYIVVGHMKEQLFYLEDKFDVELIEATEYLTRNNHDSVLAAGDRILNAYICSSDQYFSDNPFHRRELSSTFSVIGEEGSAPGERVIIDSQNLITGRDATGLSSSWLLRGPAFLSAEDGRRLLHIIEEEYDRPGTKDKLWEELLLDHIGEFQIRPRVLRASQVYEFNRLDDLCRLDAAFLENVDSSILDNICKTLHCSRADIGAVRPLTAGLTNLSVVFSCRGAEYVYRHPGAGTDELVNREAETFALETAAELGLDTTFIYEDPREGWKLSRFIPDCESFDYANEHHVEMALGKLRQLHTSGKSSPWKFDFHAEAVRLTSLLRTERVPLPYDFETMEATIDSIADALDSASTEPVLCHNDFYGPNILIHDGDACVIDWEYAAMGDYGYDLGNFIAQGSGYSPQEALTILPFYFGRPADQNEKDHLISCTAIVGWYWYIWGLYKEYAGSPTGHWLRIWYNAAKQFGEAALLNAPNKNCASGDLSEMQFYALASIADDPRAPIDPPLFSELENAGLISSSGITNAGLKALEPYRAKRAIFFAAGFGSRMLPITVNTPKPLVRVWGVRIIDRLLDAVITAGIEEIYIIRGYLKDEFNQLLEKYPTITFIDNPQYDTTNNISSALLAKDLFEDAYVFESDLLLANPSLIQKYQYRSNYLAFPVEQTDDWCFAVDEGDIIKSIAKGSSRSCWQMVGASYWNAADGRRLAEDIPDVFNSSEEAKQIFWDDVALDRCPERYSIRVRQCDPSDIVEIDTFQELQELDRAYRI